MTDKVANTSDPIVSVQLSSGEWLRFRSIDEITRYLDEARRYWSFLVDGQSLPGDSMAADIFNQLTVHDDRIRSYIHTALSDPKQEPAMAGEIQNLLVNRFGSHLALRHDTPDAAFVKELAKRNVTAAAYAANFLMRNEVRQSPNNASLSMQGVVAATLYRLGLVGRLEATQSSWDSLSVKISEEHEELRRSAGQLEDQFREHDAQIRE